MNQAKKAATARRQQLTTRYSRMLVDARENPHERIVPEGFCVTCKGFTTNYTSRGECSEFGTEVTADISEVKKMITQGRLNELQALRNLALDGHIVKDVLDEVLPAINAYKSKVEEMQEALEWYADEENYKRSEDDHQTGYPHEIMWDKGSKARQALKGNQ